MSVELPPIDSHHHRARLPPFLPPHSQTETTLLRETRPPTPPDSAWLVRPVPREERVRVRLLEGGWDNGRFDAGPVFSGFEPVANILRERESAQYAMLMRASRTAVLRSHAGKSRRARPAPAGDSDRVVDIEEERRRREAARLRAEEERRRRREDAASRRRMDEEAARQREMERQRATQKRARDVAEAEMARRRRMEEKARDRESRKHEAELAKKLAREEAKRRKREEARRRAERDAALRRRWALVSVSRGKGLMEPPPGKAATAFVVVKAGGKTWLTTRPADGGSEPIWGDTPMAAIDKGDEIVFQTYYGNGRLDDPNLQFIGEARVPMDEAQMHVGEMTLPLRPRPNEKDAAVQRNAGNLGTISVNVTGVCAAAYAPKVDGFVVARLVSSESTPAGAAAVVVRDALGKELLRAELPPNGAWGDNDGPTAIVPLSHSGLTFEVVDKDGTVLQTTNTVDGAKEAVGGPHIKRLGLDGVAPDVGTGALRVAFCFGDSSRAAAEEARRRKAAEDARRKAAAAAARKKRWALVSVVGAKGLIETAPGEKPNAYVVVTAGGRTWLVTKPSGPSCDPLWADAPMAAIDRGEDITFQVFSGNGRLDDPDAQFLGEAKVTMGEALDHVGPMTLPLKPRADEDDPLILGAPALGDLNVVVTGISDTQRANRDGYVVATILATERVNPDAATVVAFDSNGKEVGRVPLPFPEDEDENGEPSSPMSPRTRAINGGAGELACIVIPYAAAAGGLTFKLADDNLKTVAKGKVSGDEATARAPHITKVPLKSAPDGGDGGDMYVAFHYCAAGPSEEAEELARRNQQWAVVSVARGQALLARRTVDKELGPTTSNPFVKVFYVAPGAVPVLMRITPTAHDTLDPVWDPLKTSAALRAPAEGEFLFQVYDDANDKGAADKSSARNGGGSKTPRVAQLAAVNFLGECRLPVSEALRSCGPRTLKLLPRRPTELDPVVKNAASLGFLTLHAVGISAAERSAGDGYVVASIHGSKGLLRRRPDGAIAAHVVVSDMKGQRLLTTAVSRAPNARTDPMWDPVPSTVALPIAGAKDGLVFRVYDSLPAGGAPSAPAAYGAPSSPTGPQPTCIGEVHVPLSELKMPCKVAVPLKPGGDAALMQVRDRLGELILEYSYGEASTAAKNAAEAERARQRELMKAQSAKKRDQELEAVRRLVGPNATDEEVLAACVKHTVPFIDITFLPDDRALADEDSEDEDDEMYTWMRPRAYVGETNIKKLALVRNKVDPRDLVQGRLGDHWLLCAFAMLAERAEKVESIFKHHARGKEVLRRERALGGLRAMMLDGGWWRNVIVDDWLPVHVRRTGTLPIFARNRRDMCELWASVLQKGFAKLQGSYKAIREGDPLHALEDLTGFPAVRLDSRFEEAYDDPSASDSLWQDMVKYVRNGWVASVGTPAGGEDEEEQVELEERYTSVGLALDYSYAILDARDFGASHGVSHKGEPLRLLKLRNPWGGAWTGAWHPTHANWAKYPQVAAACGIAVDRAAVERERGGSPHSNASDDFRSGGASGSGVFAPQQPATRRDVNAEEMDDGEVFMQQEVLRNEGLGPDGIFWMQWADAVQYFNAGGVCFTQSGWHDHRVRGSFAAGHPNVALEIRCTKPTRAFVAVMQGPKKGWDPANPKARYAGYLLSVCVPKESGSSEYRVDLNSDFFFDKPSTELTFLVGRSLGMEYQFTPREDPYLLIPRAFDSSVTKDYVVTIISETPVGEAGGLQVSFKQLSPDLEVFRNYDEFLYEPSEAPEVAAKYQYVPPTGGLPMEGQGRNLEITAAMRNAVASDTVDTAGSAGAAAWAAGVNAAGAKRVSPPTNGRPNAAALSARGGGGGGNKTAGSGVPSLPPVAAASSTSNSNAAAGNASARSTRGSARGGDINANSTANSARRAAEDEDEL